MEGWQIAFANQSSGGLAIFDPITQTDTGVYMPTSPIPFSEWTCLVFTYHDADGAWAWYVNGLVDSQGQHNIGLSNTSASLYIGGIPPSTLDGAPFKGCLDDIAIYERTLGPEDASAFCAGRSGTAFTNPAAPTISPTIRRTSTTTPTITPTVQRTPGCDGGFSQLAIGGYAILTEGTVPNRVRSEPRLVDNNIISLLYTGATVKILGGPVCVDGLVFWKVESTTIPGGSGWTAEGDGRDYYLAPYEP
jgi:hypothetical protein